MVVKRTISTVLGAILLLLLALIPTAKAYWGPGPGSEDWGIWGGGWSFDPLI